MSFLSFTKTGFKNLFSRPVTRRYPDVPREFTPRTRGQVGIDLDQCVFCGLCARRCVADALTVTRADKRWEIDPFACINCGACVTCCPKACLKMEPGYTPPAADKQSRIHQMPPAPPVEQREPNA